MKIEKYILMLIILFTGFSCTELDLTPLTTPTTAPFTSTQQFREGLNEGYKIGWFRLDASGQGGDDDDSNYRTDLNTIKAGTVEAGDGNARSRWTTIYRSIARITSIKTQILNDTGVLSEADSRQFLGEANFLLASYWSDLISHFGDVPFYDEVLAVDEAFEAGRTDKNVILAKIYEYYDYAIAALPRSYSGREYATMGAAMAMKARIALYMGDYAIAAKAAEDCMDLDIYDLHPDYGDLFLSKTKESDELIFFMPRSQDLNVTRGGELNFLPRNIGGGYAGTGPTWELLASYECTDGLPIDESLLFDRQNPFKNRDPRCLATIVPFGSLKEGDGLLPTSGTEHLGVEFTTHPERTQIMNFTTGTLVNNNDAKPGSQYANFHGLLFKKGIDEDWLDQRAEVKHIVMRYADVLLMYAEAKIELDQIDASVLKAINDVRTRAYAGSGISAPLITTTDKMELRKKVRLERRVEFPLEGLRYMDLIRWELAEKAFNRPLYGLLTDGSLFQDVNGVITVKPDLWFWSQVPQIDEDGFANFQPLVDSGFASEIAQMNFPVKQYLYPIPSDDILIVPNLLPNNEGY